MIARFTAALYACVLCSACSSDNETRADGGFVSAPLTASDTAVDPNVTSVSVDTVATGLSVPWDIDFAPDGRVFITERAGRIRVFENGALRGEPWANLAVFSEDPAVLPESGLMGIALAPDFSSTGHVYVIGTFLKSESGAVGAALRRGVRRIVGLFSRNAYSPYENRVYRLTDQQGVGIDARVVVDDLPAHHYHAGGALRFGPDGMLYIGIGEALASQHATTPETASGAILRVRPDGSVPADNPDPESRTYAIGLRNPQALAWHDATHTLIATDHGPSSLPHEQGRYGHDELNVIRPGANYGWPVTAGRSNDARYAEPLIVWQPGIAPAGAAFYSGSFEAWRGNAFVTGLRGQQLRRIVVDSTNGMLRVGGQEALFMGTFGRLRAIRMGPDGHLWLTTSNRDGRGTAGPRDDMLLRVIPHPRP